MAHIQKTNKETLDELNRISLMEDPLKIAQDSKELKVQKFKEL